MSLSKSTPELSASGNGDSPVPTQSPSLDYVGLVLFLIKPFLESPESLRVDCEISSTRTRIWIRLAFESADKGRVFGRGGRNIQAIRTVLEAAACSVGQTAYLDVYGSQPGGQEEVGEAEGKVFGKPQPRSNSPQPSPKLRHQ